MNVTIAFWGRVYERVLYRGWVGLDTPVDVQKILEAKAAVEDLLSKKYPEGILHGRDSVVESGINSRSICVECFISVLECRNCGCLGHEHSKCPQPKENQ